MEFGQKDEIEDVAPPPVSSLRSRFEAMAKMGSSSSSIVSNGSERTSPNPKAVSGTAGNKPPIAKKPVALPTISVKNTDTTSNSSSDAPDVSPTAPALPKRLISKPTQDLTSSNGSDTLFPSSRTSRTHSRNGSDATSSELLNEAAPRRSPSTPNFPTALGITSSLSEKSGGGGSGGVSRSLSGSSIGPSALTTRSTGKSQDLPDKAKTDVDDLSIKLARRPPPPPVVSESGTDNKEPVTPRKLKKPAPPPPPPRGSRPSSPTQPGFPANLFEIDRSNGASTPNHMRSSSSSSTNLFAPALPARGSAASTPVTTSAPALPPRSPVPLAAPLLSPRLPPRGEMDASAQNVVTYHYHERPGGMAPPIASTTTAPPLPPRAQAAGFSTLAPPLPPRGFGNSAPASMEDVSLRFINSDANTEAVRRVPPIPSSATIDLSDNPSNGSPTPTPTPRPQLPARTLVLVGDGDSRSTLSMPPPPMRAVSSDGTPLQPPPMRTVPGSGEGSQHTSRGHHHHFPHLPHQLSSLPITKILATVKLGGHSSSHGGNRSPQTYTSSPEIASPVPDAAGTNDSSSLPPPIRTIVAGEKAAAIRPSSGGRAKKGSSSSDEEDPTQKKTTMKMPDDLPDSTRSNRRPPILEEFLHPPSVYASHHHVARDTYSGYDASQIHVPAHTGVVIVAGWYVIVASPGVITITNMNSAERQQDVDQWGTKGVGVVTIDMKELDIDWKVEKPRVTAMEFRHGSNPPVSTSDLSLDTTSQDPSISSQYANDEGRYLWCGTRDGCLFELDIWKGIVTDVRVGTHTGHVTQLFRLKNRRMMTIDETGKCLVFSGVGNRAGGRAGGWLSNSNPRVQRLVHKEGFAKVLNGKLWTAPPSGSSSTAGSTGSIGMSGGNGSGESKSSLLTGDSWSSLAQSATYPSRHGHQTHHRHHHSQKNGPSIRVHSIENDGALTSDSVVPGHPVGAVLCGTVLSNTPGLVYLGHEGGWVTIWKEHSPGSSRINGGDAKNTSTTRPLMHRRGTASSSSSTSSTSTSTSSEEEPVRPASQASFITAASVALPPPVYGISTTGTGPVCIGKVKISISDVITLEGVGARLWAGTRKGQIYVYDVTGGDLLSDSAENQAGTVLKEKTNDEIDVLSKPWVVTNIWKAHAELPVTRIAVDPFSVSKTQQLVVYSVGRDEVLKFWDGFLSQNWVDSQMLRRETSFCTFRPLKVLIFSWNVDAAKPDSLVGTNNVTIFQQFLMSTPGTAGGDPPDMIVFGFQEVIDLEDKKLTAKTVLLGAGKKRGDGTISEKVSRHYKLWHDRLVAEVSRAYPTEPYVVQHTENLVGLFTCVFVRRGLARPNPSAPSTINDVAITTIKCGMGGFYGNKGSIIARFTVDDTSFCFLNCHLAAGQKQKVARNMDVAAILEEKSVFPIAAVDGNAISGSNGLGTSASQGDYLAYVGGGDGSMILDHEICFLNGDLNYRIDQRRDTVIQHVNSRNLDHLLQYDQLLHEMHTNPSFRLKTFTEPPIKFAPTYKYDRKSNEYDTSEKRRIPAWCDRILYRSRDASRVENLWYGRYEADVSDHRPVCGVYRVIVKKVVSEKRAKELSLVKKMWNKERVRLCTEARAFFEAQY